ncbi:MAG: Fic family protein [Acidimicrobiales bacterium]
MSGPVEPVEFLDLDDVLGLASRLLGDPPPVRDVGLLAAAVARPQTIVGERDAYPSLCEKAAALLQSIVGNHALVDGNKRLGWVATAVFLQINGVDVTRIANDDVYGLTMAVAASELDLAAITSRLETLSARRG